VQQRTLARTIATEDRDHAARFERCIEAAHEFASWDLH
jgi:hypothetical protein